MSSTSEKALGTRLPCHWVLLFLRSERVGKNPGKKFSCSLEKYSLFCRHLSYGNTYGQQKSSTCFTTSLQNELKRDVVFTTQFQTSQSLQQIGLLRVARVQTSDWIKLRWESRQTGVTSLAAKQVCSGPEKHTTCRNFAAKSKTTLLTFCNKFSQPATNDLLQDRFDDS